tara:strand:+ start:761 stop:1162 length:402 start_codon:yes stop_codon:yes gene_type:complete
LFSCAPIIENRGYVFDEKVIAKVEIGKTNASQILELLGTPSTTSTINATTWYYVYSKAETTAFNPPTITKRRVLTVGFDEKSQVENIGEYGLEDGNIISYVERSTPTRGRELTIIQQLFGNLGRLGAGNLPGN